MQGCFQPQVPDKPGQKKSKCIFCDAEFRGGFSKRWMQLLGNTKQGGGAGYGMETIPVRTFFYKPMKIGLFEDFRTLIQVAPQHRQHKTWANCATTLEKVTPDPHRVNTSGVSFCIPAPVSVPATLPSTTTLFTIAVIVTKQLAKDIWPWSLYSDSLKQTFHHTSSSVPPF